VNTRRQVALAAACCAVGLAFVGATLSMRYTVGRLETLRGSPGHATAEAAMEALMARTYRGARVQIVGSGTDGPGLRYVVARVWPPADPEGSTPGAWEDGRYFLKMEQGWVHLPGDEILGPIVAIGKWILDHTGQSRTGQTS
jgi:hypothetical protein